MPDQQKTYCTLDGTPAVLVRMPDGRVFGYLFAEGAWHAGADLDIVKDGRVMSEAAFAEAFPDLPALPDVP